MTKQYGFGGQLSGYGGHRAMPPWARLRAPPRSGQIDHRVHLRLMPEQPVPGQWQALAAWKGP
eukprot:1978897-Rhodomonas_salina.1